ncbi:TetR/AcrR family transcriptional regulator [Mannheimia glucosida]|uniref:TetR/AcrR family transcriptional regulator n=1 Tax=Mannheimia glucosida TaxID=85401 RepID=UPI0039183607
MSEPAKDLRIVKTRLAIHNALIELIYQKDYENISVQDIVRQAMINRATFYRHYTSKTDVLDEIIADIQNERNALLLGLDKQGFAQSLHTTAQMMFEKRHIINALRMVKNRRHHFEDDVLAHLQTLYLQHLALDDSQANRLQALLFANIALTAFDYAFANQDNISLTQISLHLRQISQLLEKG